MTADSWLTSHPYLKGVAELHAAVELAASRVIPVNITDICVDDHRNDFLEGIPLLRSSAITIDWVPVEESIQAMLKMLSSSPLPGELAEEFRILCAEFSANPDAQCRVVASLRFGDDLAFTSAGLLRYLGWIAMTRYLRPLIDSFERWRDEDQWLRSYCPTCGSSPAMSQLVGADQGRRRLLCCGCCGTRWQYRRTRCPFCESAEGDRLAVLEVEGEAGLRIDYCNCCQGYLKTYAGEGSEAVMLADWTSIHLDVVARDRGLKRLAVSLYELNLDS